MQNLKTQTLLKQAYNMFNGGKMLVAADLCREILKIDSNNLEVLNLFASVLTKAGLNQHAINVFEQSLIAGGPDSGVLYNYGVALRGAGQLVQASRAFRNAAEADPNCAACWFNLGETYRRLKYHSKAINALRQAIKLDNNNASYFFTLGNALLDNDRAIESVHAYQAALNLSSDNLKYKNNLGVAFRKSGELENSIIIFQEILEQDSKNSAAHNNLGLSLIEIGRTSEAEAAYHSALNNTPEYSDASLNLADLYQQLAAFEKAELCLNRAIARDAQNFRLIINLSLVLQKQGRLKEAKEIMTEASTIKGSEVAVSKGLANVLRDLGEFDGALKILNNLSPKEPGYPQSLANLALIYQHKGDLGKAEDFLRQAIVKDPNNISFHMNLAHTLLSSGNFQEGWKEFQWRQKEPKTRNLLSDLPGEKWDGNNQFEKSVMVLCEQGFGDCFQFVRFLPFLANLFKDVTLSVPSSLFRIFKEGFDSCTIISQNDVPPDSDFHVLLMDLPYLLGISDFSAPTPYLRVRDKLVQKWADRLPQKNILKVGLNWQGNPTYETDYLRSIPFKSFTPLIESGLAEFVALQKGNITAQLPHMSGFLNLGLELDNCHSFLDTAAIMMNLDLVVTSDTAIAHLAGALGRPVWLLLNSAPDWRWQLNRQDSPWYPTMRLFRQENPRDWSNVITSVQTALKDFRQN